MGLFAKRNKNKVQTAEHVSGGESRFTFLTEQIFSIRNIGVVAVGEVSGKVCVGDLVYLYHPGIPLTAAKIDKLELAPGEAANEAENREAALYFENMKMENIRRFTVISNILPQRLLDADQAVENAGLLGLLPGYAKFDGDPDYRNLLSYCAAHANFLMAVSAPTVSNKDGVSAVPVFTDRQALLRWQDVFDGSNLPRTAVQTFGQAAAISFNGNDGVVINPFDEAPVFFSNDFIKKIMDSAGYRRGFGTAAQG